MSYDAKYDKIKIPLNPKYPEEWQVLIEFPGYDLSNYGQVRSKNSILKHRLDSKGKGYHYVQPSLNGQKKTLYIHIWLAKYFIPNPDNLPEVDHIDENPHNNLLTNLRWSTHRNNAINTSKQKTHGGQIITSKYKGVSLDKRCNKWRSRINKIVIGRYSIEIEAVEARIKYVFENKLNKDYLKGYPSFLIVKYLYQTF